MLGIIEGLFQIENGIDVVKYYSIEFKPFNFSLYLRKMWGQGLSKFLSSINFLLKGNFPFHPNGPAFKTIFDVLQSNSTRW